MISKTWKQRLRCKAVYWLRRTTWELIRPEKENYSRIWWISHNIWAMYWNDIEIARVLFVIQYLAATFRYEHHAAGDMIPGRRKACEWLDSLWVRGHWRMSLRSALTNGENGRKKGMKRTGSVGCSRQGSNPDCPCILSDTRPSRGLSYYMAYAAWSWLQLF